MSIANPAEATNEFYPDLVLRDDDAAYATAACPSAEIAQAGDALQASCGSLHFCGICVPVLRRALWSDRPNRGSESGLDRPVAVVRSIIGQATADILGSQFAIAAPALRLQISVPGSGVAAPGPRLESRDCPSTVPALPDVRPDRRLCSRQLDGLE